jgi:uncharacterized membrane protein HdeD (DUF308 family)
MNTNVETTEPEKLMNRPGWFMFRGAMMFVLGSLLLISTAIVPDMKMMGESASWLPISSTLILVIGILRCLDAFRSNSKSLFLMNMQAGIFDAVCGFVILTNFHQEAVTLSLLIAVYLFCQGLFRFIFTFSIETPNPNSVRIGGFISVLLGIMIWMNWPFSALWFLSFALSAEITTCGWALMFYAHSIKNKKVQAQQCRNK